MPCLVSALLLLFMLQSGVFACLPGACKGPAEVAAGLTSVPATAIARQLSADQVRWRHWPAEEANRHEDIVLVCVHALGLSSKAFTDFGEKMAERGCDVHALDVRGFGADRDRPGFDRLDLDTTISDIKAFISSLKAQRPGSKIYLVGESMGGAIVLKAASEFPELVAGAVCSAPAYELYKVKSITMAGIGDLLLRHHGFAASSVMGLATSSENLKKHWVEDKSHKLVLSPREAFHYYRFIRKTPRYSRKIADMPILVMQGLHDRLAKPTGSAKLFSQIASQRKQFVVNCRAEHLLLEEGQLSPVISRLTADWILDRQKRSVPAQSKVVVLEDERLSERDRSHLRRVLQVSGGVSRMVSAKEVRKGY